MNTIRKQVELYYDDNNGIYFNHLKIQENTQFMSIIVTDIAKVDSFWDDGGCFNPTSLMNDPVIKEAFFDKNYISSRYGILSCAYGIYNGEQRFVLTKVLSETFLGSSSEEESFRSSDIEYICFDSSGTFKKDIKSTDGVTIEIGNPFIQDYDAFTDTFIKCK